MKVVLFPWLLGFRSLLLCWVSACLIGQGLSGKVSMVCCLKHSTNFTLDYCTTLLTDVTLVIW